jgi:hypothetical protein
MALLVQLNLNEQGGITFVLPFHASMKREVQLWPHLSGLSNAIFAAHSPLRGCRR